MIHLAATTPAHLRPSSVNEKFAISPSHSTTSFIEAWFSLVRNMGFDEACKYGAGVANQLMSQALKAALDDNPMYDAEDVDDVA